MRKKLSILLVLCFMMSMLAACGGGSGGGGGSASTSTPQTSTPSTSEPATSGGGDVVKLGCVYPLSGSNALLGEESLRGAQLAVKELNANGGLWGKQIELVIADAPDVPSGQTETERLINKEGMELVFGAYSSSLANVCSDVCARYDVPYFELGGIGSDVMQKGYKYLWRTCSDAIAFGETQAEFFDEICKPELGTDPATTKVAIAHEDSLFGTSVGEAARDRFLELGYTAGNIKMLPYSATSVDLSSVILDSKSFGPDCFITVSYVTDAILLGRQAKELNFLPPVWIGGGAGWAMPDTKEGIGSAIYGIYDVDWPQYAMSGVPGLDEYSAFYTETFGEAPRSGHSLGEYAGAKMMLDILQKAGSLDKDAIYDAAYSMDEPIGTYTGGWGCKFDETGQNVNATAIMLMWMPDGLLCVYPEQYAMTDTILPMPSWAEKESF